MNGLERIGQVASTLDYGGAWGALEYVAVAALVVLAVAVPWHGIAVARRTRKRNGRRAPGPPPGGPVTVPVIYARGIEGMDPDPLTEDEAREFAGLVWRLRNGAKKGTARGRRTARKTTGQRTGKL